ncbi:hypothetical protein [Leminorella grimontii]|uniref:hypothetical protein n=1 Tax=Leminorella grimontii TaxID=82981 RepID=UPI002086DC05|nr:hypothetical protein [Leminorella grimontii]GKX60069.1 hypothetical protein SOASR031_23840 [Leminorella grimontii]
MLADKMIKFFESRLQNKVFLAYLVCINIYLLARNILYLVIRYGFFGPAGENLTYFNLIACFLTCLCGFFAGLLIQKKSIPHASIVTVIGVMLSAFTLNTELMSYREMLYALAAGVALGGLGGGVAWGIKWWYRRVYLK